MDFGEHGKPELPRSGVSFNLSHSGHVALPAVTSGDLRLGVDVEERVAQRAHDRLARRFFSTQEADSYATLPEGERADAFYRLWTRKEAYLKATGEGLSRAPETIELEFGTDGTPRLAAIDGECRLAAQWWARMLSPAAGFLGAVVAERR